MPVPEPQTADVSDPGKPKKLPYFVEPTGRAIIARAVQLRLACLGEVTSDDPELQGSALVSIAAEWMQSEAERIRAVRA